MTIIYSKKITPSTVAKIDGAKSFIAFISPAFVKDEQRHLECTLAEELGKPMYAIVTEEDMDWERFKKFPWRKIYFVTRMKPEEITDDIEEDLEVLDAVGR